MRLRTHLIASTLAGIALYPRRPHYAFALAMAGTLVDLDHLLLYATRTGDWSLAGAVRYDRYRHRRIPAGDSRPRYGSLRSVLHAPWFTLPAIWAAARAWPRLRPVAVGLSLHLLMDHWDWPARRAAQLRAWGRCEQCLRHDMRLSVHRYGHVGRYHYRCLCRVCAETAMRQPTRR